MKTFILGLMVLPILLDAQIVTFDFEEWINEENYERPVEWETSQDTLFSRIVKSDDSSNGEYAMKFLSDVTSGFLGCETFARAQFKIDNPSTSNLLLECDVKVIPLDLNENPFFSLMVQLYKNGNFVDEVEWETEESIMEYEKITLDLPYSHIDSVEIIIWGGAISTATDACVQNTEAWIDNIVLKEDVVNSQKVVEYERVGISYNIAQRTVNISGDYSKYNKYIISDISGRLIQKGNLSHQTISFDGNGIYILNLIGPNHKMAVEKFVCNK